MKLMRVSILLLSLWTGLCLAASPTNSSGTVHVAGASGNQTMNAGFTFTAGRQAVLVVSYYAGGNNISSLTIGGTAATKRAGAGAGDDSEIWDVLGGGVAGGTANVVFTFPGGTTDVYISFGVDEYAASTLSYDTSTANTNSQSATTAPTVSTGAAVSTTSTMLYSVVNNWGISAPDTQTVPTGWTQVFQEPDGINWEMGAGARKEETTTGTKTATWTLSTSNNSVTSIVAYIISGGGGGAAGKPYYYRQQMRQ
jgi:hypothetical protein